MHSVKEEEILCLEMDALGREKTNEMHSMYILQIRNTEEQFDNPSGNLSRQ